MNVGELFLNLGIKGTEKTLAGVGAVNKGLKDTASVSLEAKAAIVGAMYALEQMFSQSSQRGTDLTNFNALLGVSTTQTLQQYQYAAQQVSVSNQEVSSSFENIQKTMTKVLSGEGVPKWLARVGNLTGTNFTPQLIKQLQSHPEQLIQLLQRYSQLETNIGFRNEALGSMGLSDGMKAAVSRQAFRPEILAKAPTYSDKEISSLDKTRATWANLGTTIEMAFGHFNAKHGEELANDIAKIVPKVTALVEAFVKLSERLQVFKGIDLMFKGWGNIFDGLEEALDAIIPGLVAVGKFVGMAVDAASETPEEAAKKGSKTDTIKSGVMDGLRGLAESILGPSPEPSAATPLPTSKGDKGGTGVTWPRPALVPSPQPGKEPYAPKMPPAAASNPAASNVEVNQTLNFHGDVNDPKTTGDSTKKATRDAMRQSSAQGQAS